MKKLYIILLLSLSFNISSIRAAFIVTPEHSTQTTSLNAKTASVSKTIQQDLQANQTKSLAEKVSFSINRYKAYRKSDKYIQKNDTSTTQDRKMSTRALIISILGVILSLIIMNGRIFILGMLLGIVGSVMGIAALKKEGKNISATLAIIIGLFPSVLLLLGLILFALQ